MPRSSHPFGASTQQGFEGAHKVVRRIFHSATTQGGGKQKKSAIVQIFQHIYRVTWCRIRNAFEKLELVDEGTSRMSELASSAKRFMTGNQFEEVDAEHQISHPHNIGTYVSRACRSTLERISKQKK